MRHQQPPRALALLIAGFAMFGPFSIDAIFPGFPAIAKEFAASRVLMQQIISIYLAGFAVMSLFHGPLSDALGRRSVLIGSTSVFILASTGAALSSSLSMLLLCRLLQGCSAGGGVVVGRAIIRDVAAGPVAQRMIAQVMMIFAVAPAIAPVGGAYFLSFGGWRAIFWATTAFAAMLLIFAASRLKESLAIANRQRLNVRTLFSTYRLIGSNRPFVPLALSAALNFSAIFLYIASAPRFILEFLRLSGSEFYWLFVPIVAGLISGSWTAARISGRFAVPLVLRTGYAIMLLACLMNILTNLLNPPQLPWAVLPLGIQAFGVALNQPALTLLALDQFPAHRGAASSMQAFFSLTLNATVSGLLAPLLALNPFVLAAGMLTINLTGFVVWLFSASHSGNVPLRI